MFKVKRKAAIWNLVYMRFKLQMLICGLNFLFQCWLLLFFWFYYFTTYYFVITGSFCSCFCQNCFWNTMETSKWEWQKLKRTMDYSLALNFPTWLVDQKCVYTCLGKSQRLILSENYILKKKIDSDHWKRHSLALRTRTRTNIRLTTSRLNALSLNTGIM